MEGYRHGSAKTYNHSIGLSCCFRQWRAESHCNKLHGYALKVDLEFSGQLDHRNWVVDFGGLKGVKTWLEEQFDHKTIVAADDPELETFRWLSSRGLIDLTILSAVGCEKFAEFIFRVIRGGKFGDDLEGKIQKVTVWEHEGNRAWFERTH